MGARNRSSGTDQGGMRVLLLHPDDLPHQGEWAEEKWDLIVDLGFASPHSYSDWSRQLGAPVRSIREFAAGKSYRWIGRVLDRGRGMLFDYMGLDWWELTAVLAYQELEALYLVRQLARELDGHPVEFFATRPHRFAELCSRAVGAPIKYFKQSGAVLTRAALRVQTVRGFPVNKLAEIACDKWDPTYRVRRHICTRRANCSDPVVVLPSAYSNVTRTVLAYAAELPERRFLLVTTRASAKPSRLPPNVESVSLAGYAVSRRTTKNEERGLLSAWADFSQTILADDPELRLARDAGIFDYVPRQLQNGLLLRDAWQCLLEHEPAAAILCGDDLNCYTRLPLMLGKRMGLNTACCHHGALDGGLLFKRAHADTYIVKGEMERDYATRLGPMPAETVVVAAPGLPNSENSRSDARDLVFFSQPYELDGGRTREIYREIIPMLVAVARRVGKELVIKLHPFEVLKNRRRLLASLLTRVELDHICILATAPASEVLAHAWCGVGIDSSVAVECALQAIPFYLCGWLDFGGAGYMQQFARYGAGRLLRSPDELDQLAELVAGYTADPQAAQQLWQPATRDQMERVFFEPNPARLPVFASAAD